MMNVYAHWQRRLAGEVLPLENENPMPGFYRMRRKEGVPVPVAYWQQGDVVRCRVGDTDVSIERGNDAWVSCCAHPISEETYRAVADRGMPWPDENLAVTGHNQAPVEDAPEAIRERLDDLAREAEKMIANGEAKSQAACDQASDLAGTFGELEAKIKKLHTAEKAPILQEGRAIDGKWFTLRDLAADLKIRLKRIVETPFLIKKTKEAQAAAVAAVAAGKPPEQVPSTRVTAGFVKRTTALRTYYLAKIVDKDLLIASLKDHPDLVATIQKIADAAAKQKVALPGCEVISEQRAT